MSYKRKSTFQKTKEGSRGATNYHTNKLSFFAVINNGPNDSNNGALWFDIIIVQNVQNINIDVTGTVGNAGCVFAMLLVQEHLYDIKQRGHHL